MFFARSDWTDVWPKRYGVWESHSCLNSYSTIRKCFWYSVSHILVKLVFWFKLTTKSILNKIYRLYTKYSDISLFYRLNQFLIMVLFVKMVCLARDNESVAFMAPLLEVLIETSQYSTSEQGHKKHSLFTSKF